MSDKARVTVSETDKLHLGFRSVSVAFLLVNADTEWQCRLRLQMLVWSNLLFYWKVSPKACLFRMYACKHA